MPHHIEPPKREPGGATTGYWNGRVYRYDPEEGPADRHYIKYGLLLKN